METIRLMLRSMTSVLALCEHCAECASFADDGAIEVNAGSVLSLFQLNYENPITVTLVGENARRVLKDIEDDPRLNMQIVRSEDKNGQETGRNFAMYKKLYI